MQYRFATYRSVGIRRLSPSYQGRIAFRLSVPTSPSPSVYPPSSASVENGERGLQQVRSPTDHEPYSVSSVLPNAPSECSRGSSVACLQNMADELCEKYKAP